MLLGAKDWKTRGLQAFLIIAFGYLFVLQIFHAFSFTVDDAFISLRYAKHWANGAGLVWNVGDPPVEGYSNFSYVALASLLIKLNIPPLLGLKVFSIGSLAVSVYILFLMSSFFLPRGLRVLPSILMLYMRGEILWTVSGLETAFYQCLVLSITYFVLKGVTKPVSRSNFIWAGFINALAGMTRPEAPFLLITFVGGIFWQQRMSLKPTSKLALSKGIALYILAFAVIFMPYFIWRWWYFKRLFANTIYCKALFSSLPGFLDYNYIQLILPILSLALPLFIFRPRKIY
jgi:hypothetical protein